MHGQCALAFDPPPVPSLETPDFRANWIFSPTCCLSSLIPLSHCRLICLFTILPLLQSFSDVFPHLVTATDCPKLVKIEDVDYSKIDAIFCCLPHATTQASVCEGYIRV